MILLTGATGTVGQYIVRQLSAKGMKFRAMVRDMRRGTDLLGADVELVLGDFSQPESLTAALQGVERLYLLCVPGRDLVEFELNAVAAAQAAGVSHVVKMSVISADPGSPMTFRRFHGAVEEEVRKSGLTYTELWPNAFMQNFRRFAPSIRSEGAFYAPTGDAKVSLVDVHDVAAVSVAALTEDGHENKTYEITGPEALTYSEAAEILSSVLGKPVRFVDVPPDEAHKALVDAGLEAWFADALLEIDNAFRAGEGARVTSVVADVTGNQPRSFADFARAHAEEFVG